MGFDDRQQSFPRTEDEAQLTALIADQLPVCIGYVDAARRYRYVNARYQELFDRPRNTILGRTVAEVVGADNYRAVEAYVTKALEGEPCEFENSARYPRQGLRHAHFKYLPHKLETGEVAGYFVLVMDITEIHEMRQTLERRNEELLRTQRELERLALHDPLTGLGNRRLFQQQIDHAFLVAKRTGHAIGLLLIDLDGFKQINDTAGHDAGDAVLMETAERLADSCRRADTIARLGGDEFVVLMETGATVEGARDPGRPDPCVPGTPDPSRGGVIQHRGQYRHRGPRHPGQGPRRIVARRGRGDVPGQGLGRRHEDLSRPRAGHYRRYCWRRLGRRGRRYHQFQLSDEDRAAIAE